MDNTIPKPAAIILNFIGDTEAPRGYDTVFANKMADMKKVHKGKSLTQLTFDQVVADGPRRTRAYGSSACGRYQFMRDTLDKPKTPADIKGEMKLSGDELFEPDLQDQMGFHLLKRRGYAKFIAGKTSITAFGLALAKEWASFPVLADCQGQHRRVKRGQSYYAGDGLNKSLVKPADVEAVLRRALKAAQVNEPEVEAAEADAKVPEVRTYKDKVHVELVQRRLNELGYTEVGSMRPDGTYDGILGTMTQTAILAFRNDNGLPLSATIDDDLLEMLDKAEPRKIAPAREDAPIDKVAKSAPETAANWRTEVVAKYGAIGTVLVYVVDFFLGQFKAGRETLQPVFDFVGSVPTFVWVALFVAVLGAVWYHHYRGRVAGVQAFRTGARR